MSTSCLPSVDDDPALVFVDACPHCGHLARTLRPGEMLPPDDHPPCAATRERNLAEAEGHPLRTSDRHLIMMLRQVVAEPGGPWPAAHVDADPRWGRAVAWARWAGWDEADPWPDMDEEVKQHIFLPAHQTEMLRLALGLARLPDTPSTRARLRATLEGVPQPQRPPLVRVCLVTTFAYADFRQVGGWVYDGRPKQNIERVEGWTLTNELAQAAVAALNVHEAKLVCWFGQDTAAPLAPRLGCRARSLDYLDSTLVEHYAGEVAPAYRVYDGNPARVATAMVPYLNAWYRVVYNRRRRAQEEPVGYDGGLPAFQRAAHRALCSHLPGLPPPPDAAMPQRKRRG